MDLREYPRPPVDTGWGFHDSAGTQARPGDPAAFARYLRQELGVTWFKLLVAGQNKVDVARAFAQAGIEPVVRLYAHEPHPAYLADPRDVRAYVEAGVHYLEWGNEPNLVGEWNRASWDLGARVDQVCRQWLRNALMIRAAGGIPLFPALSPGGDYPHRDWYGTTFEWLQLHGHLDSLEGAALAVHNRPLNHPLYYCDASGCMFLDYEWIDDLVRQYVDHSLPLIGTEAGYEPGWHQDMDYAAITPQMHADLSLEICRGFREGRWRDALFCQCMWFVAEWGHEHEGFRKAAWHANRWHGGDLPAVEALRQEWAARPFERRFGWQGPTILPEVEAPGVTYKTPKNAAQMHQSPRVMSLADPLWLVVHGTEGPANASFLWWASPNNPYRSSAHDLVDLSGVVWRCVPYDVAAHHCGGSALPGVPAGRTGNVSNVNHASIGIELECDPEPMEPGWTAVQMDAAVAHVRALVTALGIPRERIVRHGDISTVSTDPRGFAWDELLGRVYGTWKPPAPPEEPLPEAAVRARWLSEEATRALEMLQYERAHRLLLEQTRVLYDVEDRLKAGRFYE